MIFINVVMKIGEMTVQLERLSVDSEPRFITRPGVTTP